MSPSIFSQKNQLLLLLIIFHYYYHYYFIFIYLFSFTWKDVFSARLKNMKREHPMWSLREADWPFRLRRRMDGAWRSRAIGIVSGDDDDDSIQSRVKTTLKLHGIRSGL